MKHPRPVVVIGLGEIGQLLASGFLKTGYPVYPVHRGESIHQWYTDTFDPELIVVAVGEKDLNAVMRSIPDQFKDRVLLLQNELLPSDWEEHGILEPTVLVVWLDKKKGRPSVSVLPNRVGGLHAPLVVNALAAMEIPCFSVDPLLIPQQLVIKNLYILTINLAGLVVGGTVENLWQGHRTLALEVADEVMTIQFHRLGYSLDREALMAGLLEGFEGDWQHLCTGRSAPERLRRNLVYAQKAELSVPCLERIQASLTA